MFGSSRAVALLLGISISIVTTAFLSLIEGVSLLIIGVGAIISFSISYLLIYVIYRLFIFDEINKIYDLLNKISQEEYTFQKVEPGTSSNPIKQLNAEISNYVNIKQKEIEELKKMESFRKEFLADVSHELKTPIFAAQGFIHTLLDGAIKDKNVRSKFLKKAAKSLSRLDKLVQDLLIISQMEAGTIKMVYSHFNLNNLIREVFDQFEDKAGKKSLHLCFEKECPQEVYVHADKQKIFQVLLNLISNGIKYTTDAKGLISINIVPVNDLVRIEVKDNGPGIPREDIRRIFERFYRVEKSRSKDKGGIGLGLAIVKHILEAHRQRIWVTSEIGKGSTFYFNLEKGVRENALVEEAYDA
jgi:two-component system, OmpR family, phosphate regulon sensor histidine kinase PhoR